MARTNRPDEAYHIPTLNVWFFWSCVILFVTSGGLIIHDYQREWKQVQREFRDIERERLALEKEAAEEGADQEQLKELEAKAEAARVGLAAQQAEIAVINADLERLKQQDYYQAKQDYNFAKAELGSLRYAVEEYALKNPRDTKGNRDMRRHVDCEFFRIEGGAYPEKGCDNVTADARSLKNLFLDQQDTLDDKEAELAKLKQGVTSAEAEITAAKAAITKIEKRQDVIAVNIFNDLFRDAPVVDFLVPSIKIKQAVIKEIRDDYNFATVQKEDRCMTCHLGIDKKDYEVDADTHRFVRQSVRTSVEKELTSFVQSFLEMNGKWDEWQEYFEDFTSNPKMTLDAWLEENELEEYLADALKGQLESNGTMMDLYVRTQTFKAHPDLSLYTTSASPHPMEKMGCSVCHEGRGHATDFTRSYHTPNNEADEARWKEMYNWDRPHYWDYPQLPSERATASCAKCHDAEPYVVGAGSYNEGRQLVEESGCYGCHRIQGLTENLRAAGPSLEKFASKTSEEFAYSWIWKPKHFRPSTKMPRFFEQSNNSEPEWIRNSQQEVRGMVAYLYANADGYTTESIDVQGDPVAGKQLFEEVGCLGCHSMEQAGQRVNNHGPDLTGVGSKLSAEWIYTWLRNPRGYYDKTHMPSLRLTEQEAADITTYLTDSTLKDWKAIPMPRRNEERQRTLLVDSIGTSMRRSEMNAMLDKMTPDEREIMVGQKAIAKYGCTGCHEIKGFEGAGPIGVELSKWRDKFITQLDFAAVPYHGDNKELNHTHIDWASYKLKTPRVWDRGKEKTKTYNELLKMPNFGFTDKQVDSIVTYLMGRRKQEMHVSMRPEESETYEAVQAGRLLSNQYNCQGCHYYDNRGGGLAQYWKMNSVGQPVFQNAEGKEGFNYLADVPGPVRGHVPPLLLDQGNKTRPEWLFGFLLDPSSKLRPKLKMRMPSFEFSDDETNKIIKMFAGLEDKQLGEHSSFEPDPALALIGQELFNKGQCTKCHLFVDKEPKVIPDSVLAPNLKLAAKRLQETWTPRWLADPQSIMPGANMPNYFNMEEHTTSLDPTGELVGLDENGKVDIQKAMDALNHYLIISGQNYGGMKTAKR